MGSVESKQNSQKEKEGSKKGGHGEGHSRSYPNRVQNTGYDHMRGPPGETLNLAWKHCQR